MNSEPLVSIIIANYKGKELTCDCIDSLYKINYHNYKIIVVDDCSGDGSLAYIRSRYPQVKLLHTKRNRGFAGTNNLGIRYALKNGSDYVLLLNNDTCVDENFLTELVCGSEGEKVVCPTLFDYKTKNKLQYAGGAIDVKKGTSVNYGESIVRKAGSNVADKDVSFVTGCCVLIPAKVIEKVGYLREDLFMYYEDTDYSYRLAQNKIPMKYVAKSKVYHKGSMSMGGELSPITTYYYVKNRLVFVKEYCNNKDAKRATVEYCIDKFMSGNKNVKVKVVQALLDYSFGRIGKYDRFWRK